MVEILLWVILAVNAGLVLFLALSSARSGAASRQLAAEVRQELRVAREESRSGSAELRQELGGALKGSSDSLLQSLERIRTTLDAKVRELQESNERKLDEMRRTVDEKLQRTLDQRLGESFKLVSERLDAVHKGLGEMQTLATGVGDLKRVLSNVKVRGTWAEVQLGSILEQILTPDQFGRNVAVVPGSQARVEFAIRLPGGPDSADQPVWLPVDSKFPQEDYIRLQEASDSGSAEGVQAALEALGRAVKVAAKDIHDKYIDPPNTTDFAIMYLATEGLYAEVLRQPELVDELQRRFRVVPAGPASLAALVNSLRMGFKTLAIERRASEVWRTLGAVKSEFGKFGDVLDKAKKQLATVSKTLDATDTRTRAIVRSLRSVEQLPGEAAERLLDIPDEGPDEPD